MTAPRDTIEAPATELHAATLRRWLLNEDEANGDRHHFRVRELDIALTAARDEGRREADPLVWLRKVRERLTASRKSVDYHIAMLCVENTEAEYRQDRVAGLNASESAPTTMDEANREMEAGLWNSDR